MKSLRALLVRLGGWFGRSRREEQLQEELEAHFQFHVEDNLRAGMSAAEARRAAALRFGSVDAAKEEVRAQWTVGALESTRSDVVYAIRGLRRNPGFAATAILSLALGTGAGIAIFTVADSLLLRPLPCPAPDRLVMVWEHRMVGGRTAHNSISPANYRDWQARNSVFESMAAVGEGRTVLRTAGGWRNWESNTSPSECCPCCACSRGAGGCSHARKTCPSRRTWRSSAIGFGRAGSGAMRARWAAKSR